MTAAARLRRCGAGDEAALALVGAATFLETYAGDLEGAEIVAHCAVEHAPARYAAWLAQPAALLWLAEAAETGAPVGYVVLDAAYSPLPDPRADDLEIHRIYVLSRWQGQGLGAALMETACAAAAAAGARRMRIGVRALNAPAIAFYKRMGFAVAGTRKHYIGRLEQDDLVLTRLLAPQG